MEIKYATAHRWCKEITTDTLSQFGSNDVARLRSALRKINDTNISFSINPLDADFLDWFLPMYEKRILEKDNPRVFDIRSKTIGDPRKAGKYFSLTLMEGNNRLGGAVFSLRSDALSIAYRTLETKWLENKLQASPSLYVEYLFTEHAKALGKKYIVHGKDRNPYGINSSIGLANFKLSVGCRPQLPKLYEVQTLNTDDLDRDALILECPAVEELHANIVNAYLVASKEGIEKWKSISKYPERLKVTIIERTT